MLNNFDDVVVKLFFGIIQLHSITSITKWLNVTAALLAILMMLIVLTFLSGHRPTPHHAILRSARLLRTDRKSTRLNSSHSQISYAVFCLKKKKKNNNKFLSIKKKNKK